MDTTNSLPHHPVSWNSEFWMFWLPTALESMDLCPPTPLPNEIEHYLRGVWLFESYNTDDDDNNYILYDSDVAGAPQESPTLREVQPRPPSSSSSPTQQQKLPPTRPPAILLDLKRPKPIDQGIRNSDIITDTNEENEINPSSLPLSLSTTYDDPVDQSFLHAVRPQQRGLFAKLELLTIDQLKRIEEPGDKEKDHLVLPPEAHSNSSLSCSCISSQYLGNATANRADYESDESVFLMGTLNENESAMCPLVEDEMGPFEYPEPQQEQNYYYQELQQRNQQPAPIQALGGLRYLSMMVYPLLAIMVLFFFDLVRTRNRIRSIEKRLVQEKQRQKKLQEQQRQKLLEDQREEMQQQWRILYREQQQQEHQKRERPEQQESSGEGQLRQIKEDSYCANNNVCFVLRIVCPDVVEWPADDLQDEWEPFAAVPAATNSSNSSSGRDHGTDDEVSKTAKADAATSDCGSTDSNSHDSHHQSTIVMIQVHFMLVNFLNRLIRRQVLSVPPTTTSFPPSNGFQAPSPPRKAVYMVGTTSVELLLTDQKNFLNVVKQLELLGIGTKMGLVYAYSIPNEMVHIPRDDLETHSLKEKKPSATTAEEHSFVVVTSPETAVTYDREQDVTKEKSESKTISKEDIPLIPVHPNAIQQPQAATHTPSSSVFVTELPNETNMSVMEGNGFISIPSSALSM